MTWKMSIHGWLQMSSGYINIRLSSAQVDPKIFTGCSFLSLAELLAWGSRRISPQTDHFCMFMRERERERERRLCEVWFLLHVSRIVWAFTFASDPLGRLSKESFEASFIASDTLDSYFSWITETDYCNSFGSAIAEDFSFWELYLRTTQVWLSPPNLPHCVSAAQWPWSFFNLWRRSKTKHDTHSLIVCVTVELYKSKRLCIPCAFVRYMSWETDGLFFLLSDLQKKLFSDKARWAHSAWDRGLRHHVALCSAWKVGNQELLPGQFICKGPFKLRWFLWCTFFISCN